MRRFLDLVEERYLGHLPYILGAMTFLVCSAFLAATLLQIRNARPTTEPLFETASVIVFEVAGCDEACGEFRKKIGRPHQSSALSDKLPLRYFDVTDSAPPSRYKLARDIDGGPTAVVFDIYGQERGRNDWMPSSLSDFQNRLMPHVRRAEKDREYAAQLRRVR